MKNIKTIALAGNPNSGKTTLFNGLTGGKQRIGNWPGVTVEKKEGGFKFDDQEINIVDLPGIYSLSAHSEDEKVARDFLLSAEADLVVNILDASNLERNLYLTSQIIEMNIPMIVVVNMMDIAKKKKIALNIKAFEDDLQVPVIGISAVKRSDIDLTKETIIKNINKRNLSSKTVSYPNEIESVVTEWEEKLHDISRQLGADPRWTAIKLIEEDYHITEIVTKTNFLTKQEISDKIKRIEDILKDTADIIIADHRYGFIHGIVKDVIKRSETNKDITNKIDKVVLNRFLGIPIFLVVMYFVFWLTINIGGAFIDFFDIFFGTIFVDGFGELLGMMHAPEWLIAILAGGVGAGIQTVATFVPIIFVMFLLLSILEDSGYMARAAFVMDRFMRLIGLPGKSFVPMLVGFGCTVPAIMATRTLDSKKDRMLTIFMSPFMSCGARLPVYVLFVTALFVRGSGFIVFTIYMVGILLAVLTGLLLKKTVLKGETSHFIMELPPYHAPRFKHIMLHTWTRLRQFIVRAGIVITIAVTLLAFLNSLGTDGTFGNEDSDISILSKIGRAITPAFKPMGIDEDNWPATVSLFTGLFAKEAVVGTLNSLYNQIDASGVDEVAGDSSEEEGFKFWAGIGEAFVSIPEALKGVFGGLIDPFGLGILKEKDTAAVSEEIGADEPVFAAMIKYFTPAQAYAYMLFILIYFPCLAALGAVWREVGMKIALAQMTYLTVLGWIISVLFYQIVEGHKPLWIAISASLVGILIVLFIILGKTRLFGGKKKAITQKG